MTLLELCIEVKIFQLNQLYTEADNNGAIR